MTIRHATIDDLDIITLIETASFHKTEAAKKEEIKDRLELNGDFFWLLDDCGEVLSFVHGLPTNAVNLTDDMFHTPEKYDVNGAWLMLLSVATHPFHRYRGYAQRVMRQVIDDSREQGRKGLVLTCKDHLIPFYQKFGLPINNNALTELIEQTNEEIDFDDDGTISESEKTVFHKARNAAIKDYSKAINSIDRCTCQSFYYLSESYYNSSVIGSIVNKYLNGEISKEKFIRQLTSATEIYLTE